ncbi:hypothetical protein C8Q78DRAFT_253330 [Trametes maxima]|nr:hypothetical protein C8Q78DRAFT_253330 [Trametes maxima]
MLLTYVILALSASFVPLVSAVPMSPLDLVRTMPIAPTEPGSLLGRHYSVQDRARAVSAVDFADAAYLDDHPANIPRRIQPFPKYVADRSDDSWMHVRERRAESTPVQDVNYLSHAGPYMAPQPYVSPSPPVAIPPPPPTVTIPPPPTASPPSNIPAGTLPKPAPLKPGKKPQAKHASKENAHSGKYHKGDRNLGLDENVA